MMVYLARNSNCPADHCDLDTRIGFDAVMPIDEDFHVIVSHA